ncbi:MAG: pseudouridine synthase [Alphaproteobacteria bacterium]
MVEHGQAGETGKSGERVAKVMARAGIASRRGAEALILEGRVTLNGRRLETPAITVGPKDRIAVDGKDLSPPEPTRLWRYHKPAGLLTSHGDTKGRATLFEKLPDTLPRVISIGRLDFNTEGLLLLTNDGELSRHLELPDTGWLRRYRVRAYGHISQDRLDALKKGMTVDGVRYGPIDAKIEREQGDNVWLTLALREGKNREVKKVMGALRLEVNRLIRISFGPFLLGNLARGVVEEVPRRVLREQLPERFREPSEAKKRKTLRLKTGSGAPEAEKPKKSEKSGKAPGANRRRRR